MRSLWFRLIGSFAAVIAVTLGVVILVVTLVTAREFDLYVARSGQAVTRQLAPLLADSYRENGDWSEAQLILANPIISRGDHQGMGMGGPGPNNGPGGMMGDPLWRELGFQLVLVDQNGVVAADTSGTVLGETLAPAVIRKGTPIIAQGQSIGTLLVTRPDEAASSRRSFLSQVRRAAILAGLAAGIVALLIGTLLFQRIIQPLRLIQQTAGKLAGGDLRARVPITTDDELADVAATFNQMAENLSQQQELRKQMVADIAHELRNPISVMQGTLEAMQDGLIAPTPAELGDLHSDVRRLARLVEDLRTLSLADSGQLTLVRDEVSIDSLARYVVGRMSGFAAEHGVQLAIEADPNLPTVQADEDRLAQVIGNLIDNALRHTPSGGRVTVRLRVEQNQPLIEVVDTGPGIRAEDQPFLFERFWRGDRSRSRESGGSGLGLAIVKQIVEMHGGSVAVDSIPGAGAAFRVRLPAA